MAHLVPTDPSSASLSPGAIAERDTLNRLGAELTDEFTVFHGVDWADETTRGTAIGEFDFVVVNRNGDVLLVEQKAGEVSESDVGLFKLYADSQKSVSNQVHRGLERIKQKWSASQPGAGPLAVDYLVYLPDYTVMDVNAAGIAADRIVHAGSRDGLSDRIRRVLSPGVDRDGNRHQRVLGFFRQEVSVVPCLDHALETHVRVYERLSDGLVRLAERLDMEPWRLRVRARAGSGKSQLALRTAERALERGRTTLYVCFNRPLAERVQAVLDRTSVETFHGYCRQLIELRGGSFDISRAEEPQFWREVVEQVETLVLDDSPGIETLIVDEGQDFEQEWFEILRLCLTDDAEILWVEDPLQNLGYREAVALPGFVTYTTDENHRSPPAIQRALRKWLGVSCSSNNDLAGDPVECHYYASIEEQTGLLDERVAALVEAGYAPEDIVILSVHGFRRSALSEARSVAGYPLRRFKGEYTEDGQQRYTTGRLTFESVYRFKGQQAPAVILTDIDFSDWRADHAQRVLYTGMTRARRHLELHCQGG